MQLQLSCKVALISISVASTLLLACGGGSSNPSEGPKAGAGSGVGGGTSVQPANGGSSGSPSTTVVAGTAGTSNNTNVYQGGSAGAPISGVGGASGSPSTEPTKCIVGAIRCNGNVREQSTATCEWSPLPAADQCSGDKPACTGAGLCAAYRLVQGTIDTFGAVTGNTSSNYVLTHQTLLEYPTACNQSYCVTGGIQP